jgi:hypothetical protein
MALQGNKKIKGDGMHGGLRASSSPGEAGFMLKNKKHGSESRFSTFAVYAMPLVPFQLLVAVFGLMF